MASIAKECVGLICCHKLIACVVACCAALSQLAMAEAVKVGGAGKVGVVCVNSGG